MHDYSWIDTKVDEKKAPIEQTCGCGCGLTRWRALSDVDTKVAKVDGDSVEQRWRFGETYPKGATPEAAVQIAAADDAKGIKPPADKPPIPRVKPGDVKPSKPKTGRAQ